MDVRWYLCPIHSTLNMLFSNAPEGEDLVAFLESLAKTVKHIYTHDAVIGGIVFFLRTTFRHPYNITTSGSASSHDPSLHRSSKFIYKFITLVELRSSFFPRQACSVGLPKCCIKCTALVARVVWRSRLQNVQVGGGCWVNALAFGELEWTLLRPGGTIRDRGTEGVPPATIRQ